MKIFILLFRLVKLTQRFLYSRMHEITINVPLILKVRDFMFFGRENHIISHFEGFFEGDETFLTSELS
jgi:hypothetical protein